MEPPPKSPDNHHEFHSSIEITIKNTPTTTYQHPFCPTTTTPPTTTPTTITTTKKSFFELEKKRQEFYMVFSYKQKKIFKNCRLEKVFCFVVDLLLPPFLFFLFFLFLLFFFSFLSPFLLLLFLLFIFVIL